MRIYSVFVQQQNTRKKEHIKPKLCVAMTLKAECLMYGSKILNLTIDIYFLMINCVMYAVIASVFRTRHAVHLHTSFAAQTTFTINLLQI